ILKWLAPAFASHALLGMGIAVGVLLSGALLRRTFYLQQRPDLAVRASFICFITVAAGLWVMARAGMLNGFSVFLLLALGWIAAWIAVRKRFWFRSGERPFLESEPTYWHNHWKYSKWVLATAFVFQLATQGYYWLLAGLLSVREVAELRALYLVISPMDQAFIALALLFIPALASEYAANRMASFFSLWKRFALGVICLTALFAAFVRIYGKPALHVLYAGKFDGLASILYILAFMPVGMGMGATISSVLNAAEKPKFVFLAYACSGA